MRVQVIAAAAAHGIGFPLSTFVIDDHVAIDAGALGWYATPVRQARIRHVLLTHSHLDHLAGLPIFLDNVYGLAATAPTIHAAEPTLRALQDHIFNDHIIPDFVRLSQTLPAFLRLSPVMAGQTSRIDRYDVTPFEVDHVVPTLGFLIDDGTVVIAVVTDTAPIPDQLRILAATPRLAAVLLEASFPDDHASLAAVSKHLTVSQFLEAAQLFPTHVSVFGVHVKPRFWNTISARVEAAGLPNVTLAEPGLNLEIVS